MSNKTKRETIFNKYDGHCAYCGHKIELNAFQIDHKFPKTLTNWVNSAKINIKLADVYNDIPKDINHIDNLMPTCKRCNHYKRGSRLDEFRTIMMTIHERISKDYITKVAIDYGIVIIRPWNGIFFFESYNKDYEIL